MARLPSISQLQRYMAPVGSLTEEGMKLFQSLLAAIKANSDAIDVLEAADPMVTAKPGALTASGSTNITTTAATVGLDTEELDPDSNYSVSSGEVTVSSGGYLSIGYSLPVAEDSTTGATRCHVTSWVERDQGTGTWVAIAQSYAQVYVREESGGSGVSSAFVALVADGEKLRLRIVASDTTDLSVETGEAQMSLHRVRYS